MKDNRFTGLIVATFSPFDPKGNLYPDGIRDYAGYLISKGVSGVFVCGTSGEGLLLSVSERKELLEAWMPYQKHLKIIAHVSTPNYVEASVLARHAGQVGVDAIACMGPCYLPPKDPEELVEFNRIVAASAPDTAYYYYHMPLVSGVHIKMNQFLKKIGDRIPNFSGIKFTAPDMMDMQECILMDGGKYDILHGSDGIFLSGLTAGAIGGIGTSVNIIPEVFLEIIQAYEAGRIEEARELQMQAVGVLKILHKYGGSVVSTKAILNMMGFELGPCRLPLKNLSGNELLELKDELNAIGFFDRLKYAENS